MIKSTDFMTILEASKQKTFEEMLERQKKQIIHKMEIAMRRGYWIFEDSHEYAGNTEDLWKAEFMLRAKAEFEKNGFTIEDGIIYW